MANGSDAGQGLEGDVIGSGGGQGPGRLTRVSLTRVLESVGYCKVAATSEILKIPEVDSELIFQDTQGRKLVFFLQENLYLPEFRVQQARRYKTILQRNSAELAVLATGFSESELIFPEPEAIQKIVETTGLGLYILQENQIRCVCCPNVSLGIPEIQQREIRLLQKRINQKHKHIPEALWQSIKDNIRNPKFKDTLVDCTKLYEDQNFHKEEDEYKYVFEMMKKMGHERVETGLEQALDSLGFLQGAEEYLRVTGTRDHFIHSFQVFLLGILIIEASSDNFHKWFTIVHTKDSELEATWLLASCLHDIGIPIQNLDWINRASAYTLRPQPPPLAADFYKQLGAYYGKCSGNVDDGPKLESILSVLGGSTADESEERRSEINHGVAGALTIMNSLHLPHSNVDIEWKHKTLPAAFAIAVHDRKVLMKMNDNKLLPLSIEQFPIAALLVICDYLQGFGRPGRLDDPHGEKSILFGIETNNKKVAPKIWFEQKSDAILSRWEFNEILQKCVTSREIRFELQPYSDKVGIGHHAKKA